MIAISSPGVPEWRQDLVAGAASIKHTRGAQEERPACLIHTIITIEERFVCVCVLPRKYRILTLK